MGNGKTKLTWNAKMIGIYIFPLSFAFGPSINFWSTRMPLFPFKVTSVMVLTKFGIQGVPVGRIWNSGKSFQKLQYTHKQEMCEKEKLPSHHVHSCYTSRCSQPKQQEYHNSDNTN